MKLSILGNDSRLVQLRTIAGRNKTVVPLNNLPISYLFVESVVISNVLSESGLGTLNALFKSGMARLRAAIAPGTSDDLGALLAFMAPRGGGIEAVKNLLDAAPQSNEPLVDNISWWNEIFAAFGVKDSMIKKNILDRVKSEQPTQLAEPTQPEQSTTQQPGFLRQERQPSEHQHPDNIRSQLDDIRRQREENRQAIGHLRNRLEQAQSRVAESISDEIALILLSEESVINNVHIIGHHFQERLGSAIALEGLYDRAKQTFSKASHSLRNIAANPEYSRQQLASQTKSSDNIRIAKLAIQILTDHLREIFRSKLEAAQMTPEQIVQKIKIWSKLQARMSQSKQNPTPDLVDAYVKMSDELKTIFKLFNHGNTRSQFDI